MIRIDIEGCVKFNVEVKEADMKSWEPERIERFFSGIAQVTRAVHCAELAALRAEENKK